MYGTARENLPANLVILLWSVLVVIFLVNVGDIMIIWCIKNPYMVLVLTSMDVRDVHRI